MSDRNLADLDPRLQPLAQQFLANCSSAGIDAFITQTYRCEADQNADYAKGRTEPGHIITNARYGQSPHNCTLPDGTPAARAFDFGIIDPTDKQCDWNPNDVLWKKAIAIGQALGLVSGSTFHSLKDSPHFELANWKD